MAINDEWLIKWLTRVREKKIGHFRTREGSLARREALEAVSTEANFEWNQRPAQEPPAWVGT